MSDDPDPKRYRVEFSISVSGWIESPEPIVFGTGVEVAGLSEAKLKRLISNRWYPRALANQANDAGTKVDGVWNDIGKIEKQRFTKLKIIPKSPALHQLAEAAE